MQNRDYNYLLESSILFLINAIVFYMYDSLLKTGNEKYKTAVLEEQNHSYANQLKVYQEAVQKDKIVRHDMKNHLHQIKRFCGTRTYNGVKAIYRIYAGNDGK